MVVGPLVKDLGREVFVVGLERFLSVMRRGF